MRKFNKNVENIKLFKKITIWIRRSLNLLPQKGVSETQP